MGPRDTRKDDFRDPNRKGAQKDQRYIPRWEVNNRILYQLPDEENAREARTRDLSCAGICLQTDQDLGEQKKVRLTIYLSGKKSIQVDGQIRWTRKTSQGTMVGVIFENIQPEDQELILDYAFEVKKDDLVKHWFQGWDDNR